MKKYILILVVALFSITSVLAAGPGLPGPCPCCEEKYIPIGQNEPLPGDAAAYQDCLDACDPNDPDNNPKCSDLLPINSFLIILVIAGAALGTYFVSTNNKKRQLEI